jgi:hypothetical protein
MQMLDFVQTNPLAVARALLENPAAADCAKRVADNLTTEDSPSPPQSPSKSQPDIPDWCTCGSCHEFPELQAVSFLNAIGRPMVRQLI